MSTPTTTPQPQGDGIRNTMSLINHLFESKNQFGLDWIQLSVQNPTQHLPVLICQSFTRENGKSTFAQWLKTLHGDTATKLKEGELESRYNGGYIEKRLIIGDGIDITHSLVGKLKEMTNEWGTVTVKRKGHPQYETVFRGHFLFCINYEIVDFAPDETRFAVIKTPKLQANQKDPDFLQKLIDEIPAFLRFLESRTLHYPRVSRLYFAPEIYLLASALSEK